MGARIRIGAVGYLNTRPLVLGLEQGLGAGRVELTYGTPAALADAMAAGRLDVGLLPVVELARIPDLEIVSGLSISTYGPSRSVLLVGRGDPAAAARVALDPESRTSNVLAQVLFDEVWKARPEYAPLGGELETVLARCDAAVRIGDKALFDPLPAGLRVRDLGAAWTDATGLPFVFAVWAARRGVVDRALYRLLHDSRRAGCRRLEAIAGSYAWRGRCRPAVAREYLERHIRYRLGADELRAMRRFLAAAARLGRVERAPEPRMALGRRTSCHEAADRLATTGRSPE